MASKQNVIAYLDFSNSKIILMLNIGGNLNNAKIEEFEFDKKKNSIDTMLESFGKVLENFVNENLCKQAEFFVVVPDECICLEYIKVPNAGVGVAHNIIKTELERLYQNCGDWVYQETIVSKSKKSYTYKVSLVKKEYVNKINDTYKKLNLNLKGMSYCSNTIFWAWSSILKLKHSQMALIDMRENDTTAIYVNKDRIIAFYTMPYGKKQQDSCKSTGILQKSLDSFNEIYLNNLIGKNTFKAVQIDLEGESKEQKENLDKIKNKWKKMQAKYLMEFADAQPIVKILQFLNENIIKYDFPNIVNVYTNIPNEVFEHFKEISKTALPNMDTKNVNDDLEQLPIKDYLHLFGAIVDTKNTSDNLFDAKKWFLLKK